VFKGSSPKSGGIARPSKDVEQRFND